MRPTTGEQRKAAIAGCVLVVVAGASASGGSLTGRWIRVSDDAITDSQSEARINKVVDSFCGSRCEVILGSDTLTIVRDEYPSKPRVVFKLDGSTSVNKFTLPSADVVLESIARKVGEGIEISTRVSAGDIRSNQALTVALQPNDQMLVSRQIQRPGGGSRKQIYARKE